MFQVLPPEPAPVVAPAPTAIASGVIERSVATEGEVRVAAALTDA